MGCLFKLFLLALIFCITMSLMLRKRLFARMNNLTGLVIGDLFRIVVIVSIYNSLSVNISFESTGPLRH